MNRLAAVNKHFSNDKAIISKETIKDGNNSYPEIIDYHPDKDIKINFFKLRGWGYKDSGFEYIKDAKKIKIKGSRYMFGGQYLPKFGDYVTEHLHIDVNKTDPEQQDMDVHPPIFNHEFLDELGIEKFSRRSFMKWERIMHSHGACLQEVWQLRYTKFTRVADCVVYPNSTEDCEHLVQTAHKHNVVLVPYGGGTNVTKSLQLNDNETRMIVSVDMARMNQIKWVDKENNMACIGAGIQGQDLERDLKKYGVCSGHEPDSQEFSTLGGWISTRASGMKKNTYGNIEDMLCNVTYVTPTGTYTKTNLWPRISNGPDMTNVVMGSEGNYGIITEAVLRVRPIPQVKIYDSLIFHNYEIGIKFMQAVSKTSSWPTSIRLVDNTQFQFGASLKPQSNSMWEDFVEAAKKFFVVKVKGYDPNEMAACTMLFEGDEDWARAAHATIIKLGKQFGGLVGGPENGMRGYLLTFLIAYTRDLAMEHYTLGESFELSCPWNQVSPLQKRVKQRLYDSAAEQGFSKDRVWVSFRVTQLYETGAAIYVYLTLYHHGMDREHLIEKYEAVEDAARDEVMKCGGSISHHHGVGKIRKKFMTRTVTPNAFEWQNALKKQIDPKNIFACNNTIARSPEEEAEIAKECAEKFGNGSRSTSGN